MRYFIEILNQGKHYASFGGSDLDVGLRALPNPNLGKDASISLKDQHVSLRDLVNVLIDPDQAARQGVFDARCQLEIGRYLYEQTFGYLPETEQRRLLQADNVDVRIITQDEHIARLPWALLCYSSRFLCQGGWSISISGRKELIDQELPPSPRILVVAPKVQDVSSTNADQHLESLERKLSAHDHRMTWDRNLQRVETWEAFRESLTTFKPQIVYFYGHGKADEHTAQLLFAQGNERQRHWRPVADFALCLRNMDFPPNMVYVNCCLGTAAGLLGVGQQLEEFVPAVITNRTLAAVDAAQAQAMSFWESVLIRGWSPHQALSAVYSGLTNLDLSTADVRWLNPVLHCHYGDWRSNPPTPPERLDHDPNWHLKIDRIKQYSIVAEQTRQMLRERRPHSQVFVWYGKEGEGIEIFHQRLGVELSESLERGRTHLHEVRPEWPMEFEQFHRSCEDMLIEAFGVNSLQDIPARIRSRTAGASGLQTLIYVRHQPIRSRKVVSPVIFQRYLEWWDAEFVPLLEPNQFSLLGVSFLVNKPAVFQKSMTWLEQLDLHDSVVRLLDQMETLALRDLRDFLRTHQIRLPIQRRDQILEEILALTNGRYEQTVQELRNLVDRAWDLTEDEAASAQAVDDDEDW